MSNNTDGWSQLRHSGLLLSPRQLAALPEPPSPPPDLPHRIQQALHRAATSRPTPDALIDVLLSAGCGLRGWETAPTVRLPDGTRFGPARCWTGEHGAALPVFTAVELGREPDQQVLAYLQSAGQVLGVVTSGLQWQVVHSTAGVLAWSSWDSADLIEGDRLSACARSIRRLLSVRSLTPEQPGARSPLLRGIHESHRERDQQSRQLGSQLRLAVEHLLAARRPVIDPAWSTLPPAAWYRAACRFVMRLIVVLFAEAQGLLPLNIPAYAQRYSLWGLRDSVGDAWHRLRALFHLLDDGSAELGLMLPAGGDLFRPGEHGSRPEDRALRCIEGAQSPPSDDTVQELLRLLTRSRDGAPIHFRGFSSEHIGIIYEGLLDYELRKVGPEETVVVLRLGGQPALPLSRLMGLSPQALASLLREHRPFPRNQTMDQSPRSPAWVRAIRWAKEAFSHTTLSNPAALIADVKEPGALYLIRWGGTRKGDGAFYTRPQLTMPTVRRTLAPLLGAQKTPEQLLALKVCDPAVGSGSFLIAALRVLTQAVLHAIRLHGRVSETPGGGHVAVASFRSADQAIPHPPDSPSFWEVLATRVRRCVAERCLHGVDINPLAVSLARAALWMETRDQAAPLSLLDQKVLEGDALLGCWTSSPAGYPIQAWQRASTDPGFRQRRDAVFRELAELIEAGSAGSPAGSLRPCRADLDLWCALWFWPLSEIAQAPGPAELQQPTVTQRQVADRLRQELRFFHWELAFPDVFDRPEAGFDAVIGNPPWELLKPNRREFFSSHDPLFRTYERKTAQQAQQGLLAADPACAAAWRARNLRLKALANFVRHASQPFGDAERVRIRRGPVNQALHRAWQQQRGPQRQARPFRHQGTSNLNTYKLFIEAGLGLLRSGGQIGMIVPSGLYTDKGTAPLRRMLLERCQWRWLYGLENRERIFDIHRSFKFCVIIAEKGGQTEHIQAAFMRHSLRDWAAARGTIRYSAAHVTRLSPRSLGVLEIRSSRDLQTLNAIYRGGVLLGHDGPNGWQLSYAREFDMTNDASSFSRRLSWETTGYRPDAYGRWRGPDGDSALPLYEGRMIGQLDFSQKGWVSGSGRGATWRALPWAHKRIEPQFLMAETTWRAACVARARRRRAGDKVAFMAIGAATNQRSMLATVLRDVPCGNAVPVLQPSGGVVDALTVAAALNAFVYDFALRTRLGGLNLNYFVIAETPLPQRISGVSAVAGLCARLSLAHPWFSPTWLRLAAAQPALRLHPMRWALTRHERLRLRAMLDAIVAACYGLGRQEMSWILRDCDHPAAHLSDRARCRHLDPKGFWRVDRDQHPEHRHTVLSLVAFHDLMVHIESCGGDRAAGIRSFCAQHNGEGWLLPEELTLCEVPMSVSGAGLGRDRRASRAQSVRSVMGPRFLPKQRDQGATEYWSLCEARAQELSAGQA